MQGGPHALRKALLVLTLVAALPARGAIFDDDEARRRIEDLRTRVDVLERSTASRLDALESVLKNQGLVDMFRDVEQIKSDLAKLRGQYEVLTYELDQAQKRQRDLYVDLDSRLRRLEAAPEGATPGAAEPAPSVAPGTGAVTPVPGDASSARFGPPGPAVTTPPSAGRPALATAPPSTGRPAAAADAASEQRAYDAALEQFKSGGYGAASASFQAFVKAYPKSPLAASALYWAGNAQYAQRDFRAAIGSQRQLLAAYPDSQKVPDALLNIASSQVELGDTAGARRTLEDLVARHPGSEAAVKAKQRLAGSR